MRAYFDIFRMIFMWLLLSNIMYEIKLLYTFPELWLLQAFCHNLYG